MHSFFKPKESTYFKGIVNPGDFENKCLLLDPCHLMVHSFDSTFVCILTLEPFLYHAISDPHFIPRGVICTPTISSMLGYTNIKFCKLLEIPFKVSENTRFVKNLFYGYHGNCLITWCFSLISVKMVMKNK